MTTLIVKWQLDESPFRGRGFAIDSPSDIDAVFDVLRVDMAKALSLAVGVDVTAVKGAKRV